MSVLQTVGIWINLKMKSAAFNKQMLADTRSAESVQCHHLHLDLPSANASASALSNIALTKLRFLSLAGAEAENTAMCQGTIQPAGIHFVRFTLTLY